MNSNNRAELFDSLYRLCDAYPNWRFGQLVANAAEWTEQGIWDVEDQQLVTTILSHLSQRDGKPIERTTVISQ